MEALEFIEAGAPADIMLLDIRMPVKSGTDVMRECARALPAYPVVRGCSCIFVMLSCERGRCHGVPRSAVVHRLVTACFPSVPEQHPL